MTIRELRERFLAGTYTPLDAYQHVRDVIAEKDGDIHAYLDVYDDAGDAAAAATERLKAEGENAPPLLGVPLAIKNNILIKGKRATGGSKILENYTATYDATIIERLRAAGAVFVGSTNLDEFAMGSSTENSAFGPTKNPHDLSRVPGGSSGGPAAAVAMGSVPAAIGTDTGGSVRQPASFCGLVGFKPTYGAISRYGLMAMGSSLDQAGPLTNSVADAELLHSAMCGLDPMDATTITDDTYPAVPTKERYTIGVPRTFLADGIDADVMERFEAQVAALTAAGHTVVDVDLPLLEQGLAAYYIVMPAEVSSNLARYDGMRYGTRVAGDDLLSEYLNSRAAGFGAEAKRRILLGTYVLSSGYYDAYYAKAEAVRVLMRQELATAYEKIDLILMPTAPTPAFKLGEQEDPLAMYRQDIFTVPVNLTGVPALAVPAGSVLREGVALPVGVQYIAPHAGEARLFDIGKRMHDSTLGA
ncbi:MAG: Asp-tRNA(Asn)/Glu-tRNA(Gln) amidotransferase subunit GatA [Candidatus Paceibacterota bacterium]